jgi:hypothetical protein
MIMGLPCGDGAHMAYGAGGVDRVKSLGEGRLTGGDFRLPLTILA